MIDFVNSPVHSLLFYTFFSNRHKLVLGLRLDHQNVHDNKPAKRNPAIIRTPIQWCRCCLYSLNHARILFTQKTY